jgi:hypothetical protein
VIELFANSYWFHAGYTLLVEITEPSELAGYEVDVQTRGFKV